MHPVPVRDVESRRHFYECGSCGARYASAAAASWCCTEDDHRDA